MSMLAAGAAVTLVAKPELLDDAREWAGARVESAAGSVAEIRLSGPSHAELGSLAERREFLLGLINADRQTRGMNPVALGANPAAQDHAEEMLQYSYLSHWGLDGLKPYMRFTLAGGGNYSSENVSGIPTPLREGGRYARVDVPENLARTQRGFMNSPGHRSNILDPWHQVVNLGIACGDHTCAVVQQFAGNYVDFTEPPRLDGERLEFSGSLSPGWELDQVQVWYDQPPHPLTLGQLELTSCYTTGALPAAFVRPPPPPERFYADDSTVFQYDVCRDPYDNDPAQPRSNLAFGAVISNDPVATKQQSVRWVTASRWDVSGEDFSAAADLSGVLEEHGPGVYTVVLWGGSEGAELVLTEYSVFVE